MTKYVGLKELRQNIDKYAAWAKRGDNVIIMKHNKPLFRVAKVEEADPFADEGNWESIIDFTKIKPGGVPAEEVLTALRKIEQEEKSKKLKRG